MSRRLRAADPEQELLESPELVSLVRLLTRVEGFALAFLESNVPVTAERIVGELIRALEARGRRGRLLRLDEAEEDLLGRLRDLTPPVPPGEALFVLGFERAIPSRVAFPPALTRLNRAREQFRELASPLVLVLPRYALDQLSREAPDFWAWRSGVFEARVEKARLERMVHDVSQPSSADYENLSAERKREHLEVLRGLLTEIEARGDGMRRARGNLHFRIALLLDTTGQWPEAEAAAAKALELAQDADDRQGEAAAGHQLGILAERRGDLAAAEEWYRKALEIVKALDDRSSMAASYHHLGWVAQHRGDLVAAEERYRESLEINEGLGDRAAVARTCHQLGNVAQLRGDLEAAEAWYQEALEIDETLGDQAGMAITYRELGRLAQLRGDLAAAEEWYRTGLDVFEGLGNWPVMASSYIHLGMLNQDRGELVAAEERYRKGLEIFEGLGNRPGMASAYGQLGLLAEARGETAEALDWTIRCVAQFSEFPHPATGPGPDQLARLTGILGKDALKASWQRLTGAPLPGVVADFVAGQLARAEDDSESPLADS